MQTAFDIPVIIFVYKRPNETLQLLKALSKVRPSKIYFFANGPQNDNEIEICNSTHKLIEQIDWPCELISEIRPKNIGLSNQIISGLNRVFTENEMALVFEDDCIPAPQFFDFAKHTLLKYKDNESIMHISGTNILHTYDQVKNLDSSYFFSRFALPCWGWASWSRAWKKFNPEMDTWNRRKKLLFTTIQQKNFESFTTFFSHALQNKIAWDVQWMIDIWNNQGLVIVPKENLVTNIGFDEHSTFTKNNLSSFSRMKVPDKKSAINDPNHIQLSDFDCIFEDRVVDFIKEF